jgi:hypothetical protein
MPDWINVVTHPLGLTGFALFLVFGYLVKVKRDDERRWLSPAAVGLAAVALAGDLILAYVQAPNHVTSPAQSPVQSNVVPAQHQTNQVQQSTTRPGSPAVKFGIQCQSSDRSRVTFLL